MADIISVYWGLAGELAGSARGPGTLLAYLTVSVPMDGTVIAYLYLASPRTANDR